MRRFDKPWVSERRMALLGMLGQHCMLGLGHLKIAKQYSARVAEKTNFAQKKQCFLFLFSVRCFQRNNSIDSRSMNVMNFQWTGLLMLQLWKQSIKLSLKIYKIHKAVLKNTIHQRRWERKYILTKFTSNNTSVPVSLALSTLIPRP